MRTSALFGAKNIGFFEIYGVSALKRGLIEPVRTLCGQWRGISFFAILCGDVWKMTAYSIFCEILRFIRFSLVRWAEWIGPIYTWRKFTGVKLNNNRPQYCRTAIFRLCNRGLEPDHTRRKVFRLCLLWEHSRMR